MATAVGQTRGRIRQVAGPRAYAVRDGEWMYAELVKSYGVDVFPPDVRKHFRKGETVVVRQRQFLYDDGTDEIVNYHVVSLKRGVWQRPILKPSETARYVRILRVDGDHVPISAEDRETIKENSRLYTERHLHRVR